MPNSKEFMEIVNSMTNGNWGLAAEECIVYDFYAIDIIREYNFAIDEGIAPFYYIDAIDFVELMEMVTKIRYG